MNHDQLELAAWREAFGDAYYYDWNKCRIRPRDGVTVLLEDTPVTHALAYLEVVAKDGNLWPFNTAQDFAQCVLSHLKGAIANARREEQKVHSEEVQQGAADPAGLPDQPA